MLTKPRQKGLLVLFYCTIFTDLSHAIIVNAKNYSTWMLDSIIANGDGIGSSGAATSQIELACMLQEIVQMSHSHDNKVLLRASSRKLSTRRSMLLPQPMRHKHEDGAAI